MKESLKQSLPKGCTGTQYQAHAQRDVPPGPSFVYVLAGMAETHGATLAPEASPFTSGDEGAVRITAGPAGARVLLAQFLNHFDDE